MSVELLLAYWVVSFLLTITPGADWAFVIAAGLREKSVVPSVAGLLVGYTGLTAVVAAGLAVIVSQSELAMLALSVSGGVYLLWLGFTTLKNPTVPTDDDDAPRGSAWTRLWVGAGVSGLNPKALLLFVALLPQFVDSDGAWPIGLQLALLGLIHMLNTAAVYSLVGVFAARILRSRPATAVFVSRLSGMSMVLIGLVLLGEKVWEMMA
ncbi:threonine/homoserine/homoserine lactone efflux protein [Microbacteriaceae bacterium MWH-Ta3]|nr:threonine/homoserine/homoserine lactone efflux protein [Microbacteriaceae bacterium MWH-Ta3]